MCELYLNHPQELEAMLQEIDDDGESEDTSLAEELFGGDQTKKALESYQLLRQKNEVWDDSYMESPLSKCLSKEVRNFGSAKLLMNYILDRGLSIK